MWTVRVTRAVTTESDEMTCVSHLCLSHVSSSCAAVVESENDSMCLEKHSKDPVSAMWSVWTSACACLSRKPWDNVIRVSREAGRVGNGRTDVSCAILDGKLCCVCHVSSLGQGWRPKVLYWARQYRCHSLTRKLVAYEDRQLVSWLGNYSSRECISVNLLVRAHSYIHLVSLSLCPRW